MLLYLGEGRSVIRSEVVAVLDGARLTETTARLIERAQAEGRLSLPEGEARCYVVADRGGETRVYGTTAAIRTVAARAVNSDLSDWI